MYGGNGYVQGSYSQPYNLDNLRVDGRQGVEAVNMGPNGFGMFLDKNNPILWVKTTDQLMIPCIKGYRLTPLEEATVEPEEKNQNGSENKMDLEETLALLVTRMDEMERTVQNIARESNTSANRREQSQQSNGRSGNKQWNGDQKHDEHAQAVS